MSNASGPARIRRPPTSERELYEREERLALAGLVVSTERLVADLASSARLPETARRHPLAASMAGAVGGVLAYRGVWRLAVRLSRWLRPSLAERALRTNTLACGSGSLLGHALRALAGTRP